jgi:molecular chaperone GrpE
MDEPEKNIEGAPDEFEKLRKERDEYLDGWKRAKADYLNYKREESERLAQWGKLATEGLVYDLLLVLDSFRLGLTTMPEGSDAWKGMSLVKGQLEDILRRHGLEKISASPGKPFDPSHEEAIGEIESDLPEGTVVEEAECGWKFGGRVLRPAKVKISKNKNT